MYEIKFDWYNHISGHGSDVYETKYTNINAAKRQLLDMVLEDDNLYEEDAVCEIDKDLEYAKTTGRHDDYCEYYIRKIPTVKVDTSKVKKITEEELQKLINERKTENDTLIITVE